MTQKIAAGTLAIIPLTLTGVVHSISVSLQDSALPAGTAGTTPAYVTALDASGAAIVGPGNFNAPVTLSDSDTSGTVSLSTTTVTAPGAKVTLAYSGHSIVQATIGASAAGVPPANVMAAIFAPAPRVFASFTLPNTLAANTAAYAIAAGPDGNLWVTTQGGSNAILKMTPAGVFTAFVGGTWPNLTADEYEGIAPGPDGNVWFTENSTKKIGRITPSRNRHGVLRHRRRLSEPDPRGAAG